MHDMTYALRKMRLQHEEGQNREDEVRSELTQARKVEEKAQKNRLRNHDLLERCKLKNKDLRMRLATQEEKLEASRQSMQVTEEQLAGFRESTRKHSKDLSLVKEKPSKMEKLLKKN